MYRPMLRMDDRFREWLNDVTMFSSLNMNQVVRLSMFLAGHSKRFESILDNYLKNPSKPLPPPKWEPVEHGLWLNQTYERREGETSHAIDITPYDFELIDGRGPKRIVRANERGIIKWTL